MCNNVFKFKAETFLVTAGYKDDSEAIKTYSHPGQEFNYIIEGTLKITINNQELILEAGDSIYFNSGYNHGMKALNGKDAKFLAIIF